MTKPQSIEEGIARLASRLTDDELNAANEGEFGEAIRLLTLSEQIRRSADVTKIRGRRSA
ncbi:hypothetical protein EFK50_07645 [Nocardioides marmoriginsengisoli]|uniref:Uncharacterized protein n=1 Tax=Nocardioides marmoriginsengisoli TaxID=661483 RepID=A0A3N0CLQ9_9ACTN|nr:hypothetical protein [Nocardioides marmoriginsengisoli]RNL64388.1 hypothetical protein EFK50_07645 [Nocardioides marmoriginsengisoli]